ncbi:MAG: N-acetylmuramoyl-L-alanine amidase [Candidatus Krumholzibacteriia bacterium]
MIRIARDPHPRPASGRVFLPVVAILLPALVLTGCGGPPRPGAPLGVPGFEDLQEDLEGIDTRPLLGRRIVLDPGHGGRFRGAVGPNGLEEADVNLGVALYLRGLLEWAGSEVFMTRTTDRDFTTASDSTLASDLAFRVSFTDSLQPDVFISIHHNSNPTYDPVINETQTYYPLGASGASVDLARAVHRHLAVNLQIRPARLLPGNFHVLRNATVPAVLGEPAMISHPVMAGRLSLARSHRLEAEAYFLGLLEYFSLGAPRWSGAARDTVRTDLSGRPPSLTWTFQPDAPGTDPATVPGPDPSSFRLTVDGREAEFGLSADGATITFQPTLDGRHGLIRVAGRNLAGRSTPERLTLLVNDAARPLVVTQAASGTAGGEPVLLVWRTGSGDSLPAGSLEFPDGARLATGPGPAGTAWPPRGRSASGRGTWTADDGTAEREAIFDARRLPEGWSWREIVPDSGTTASLPRAWRARGDAPLPTLYRELADLAALPAVPVLRDDPIWFEAPGWVPLTPPPPGEAADGGPLTAHPLETGLHGMTVVIDPRGGGTLTDGRTELGRRGSDLNLETALQLEALLRGAGAEAVLTRRDDQPLPDADKALLARRAGAGLFIQVGRRSPAAGPAIRHYPGSVAGSAWAAFTARTMAQEGAAVPDSLAGPGADYLLRHTHCAALVAEFPLPEPQAGGGLTADAWLARTEASLLFQGLVGQAAGEQAFLAFVRPDSMLRLLPPSAAADPILWAVWDGNFVWAPAGRSRQGGPSAGNSLFSTQATRWPACGDRHTLEIHRDSQWQFWLLEQTGGTWSARMLRSGSPDGQ